jgi:hypothetical protein
MRNEVIFLDTGPLGLLTHPKKPLETIATLNHAIGRMCAEHPLLFPAKI